MWVHVYEVYEVVSLLEMERIAIFRDWEVGIGNSYIHTEFHLGEMKFWLEPVWCLHNNANIICSNELPTYIHFFKMLGVFCHRKKAILSGPVLWYSEESHHV